MDSATSHASAYKRRVDAIVAAVAASWTRRPAVGILLGIDLGVIADALNVEATLPYENLPDLPVSAGDFHSGQLLAGSFEGVPAVVFQGCLHEYQGLSPQEVTLPVRVLACLGARVLLISNAAAALDPHFRRGDLMLVADHINLQGDNPLVGTNIEAWGPRFPDMTEPYDVELRQLAEQIALENRILLRSGVHAAVSGPTRETRAECRYLRRIGADAVGMGTAPEVIVARHAGLRVLALNLLTEECVPDGSVIPSTPIATVPAAAAHHLATIFQGVVRQVVD